MKQDIDISINRGLRDSESLWQYGGEKPLLGRSILYLTDTRIVNFAGENSEVMAMLF